MQGANSSKIPYAYLPHVAVSLRVIVWSVLTGIAITLPVIYSVHLLPLPEPDAQTMKFSTEFHTRIFLQPWWIVLQGMILAPLLEEGFFRGLMLQMLRRYVPFWPAVSLPTLLFAIGVFT